MIVLLNTNLNCKKQVKKIELFCNTFMYKNYYTQNGLGLVARAPDLNRYVLEMLSLL